MDDYRISLFWKHERDALCSKINIFEFPNFKVFYYARKEKKKKTNLISRSIHCHQLLLYLASCTNVHFTVFYLKILPYLARGFTVFQNPLLSIMYLWKGVLKLVTCLRILLFLNNRSIVHFLGMWCVGGNKTGRDECMVS